jgi:membrane-associated phospholipid phosphatase
MNTPDTRPSPTGWLHRAAPRLLVLWLPKMLGTTFGMAAFFIAYFWVLNHPQGAVTVMPLTFMDRLVSFQPAALPLYLSLWVYVSLAPALIVRGRELLSYGAAAAILSLIGLGLFAVWPTAVPPADVDWSRHPAFAFLKAADASGNACPSLHVAFAVFTAFWFARLLRQLGAGTLARAVNWLWCLGILWSTLATRQHVALDVLAGALLGATVAAAHLRWLNRPV